LTPEVAACLIRSLMLSRAEFLKSTGERFERYAPLRVARTGCLVGIALAVLVVAGGVAGMIPADPIFPRFFRVLVLTVIAGVLAVFVVSAGLETAAERRARRELEEYVASGGGDPATLLEMARARKGRFPGSERVIELLEKTSAAPPPSS